MYKRQEICALDFDGIGLDVIDNSDAAYISFNTKNGTLTAGGSLASLEELLSLIHI